MAPAVALSGQEVVVPALGAQLEGAQSLGIPLTEAGRVQILIDRAHFARIGGPAGIREIWLRRDVNTHPPFNNLQGGIVHLQILASTTAVVPIQVRASFAANRGPGHAPVFDQDVTLPALGQPPSTPAPWAEPHAVRLPLQGVILDNGGHLCLEFVTTPAAGHPMNAWWIVDGWDFPRTAITQDFGASCGGLSSIVSRERLRPGSIGNFALRGKPALPCLHVLGLSDQSWGGVRLPLDLTPMRAPGCSLYTDWAVVTAHATDAGARPFGLAHAELRLPFDPALLGSTVYSQWFQLDPWANALGLTTSHGVRATMESVLPPHGVGLVFHTDLQAAEGKPISHVMPILRFVQ